MKMISIGGNFSIFDGEKEINVDNAAVAFGYVMTMMQIRPIPCTVEKSTYPVLSLVPHPKKRRITKKYRELIKKIKSELPPRCI